jgi:CRP/FNR family cyclic AMP-dependent transcriptional regulator
MSVGRERGPNANIDAAMASSPILQGVAENEVVTLAEAGVLHSFRRGTYLCHQGDEADEVFFLSAGRVEISSISPTGTRVLHATVDTPQFLGELGVFGDLRRSADMLTLDESEIWSVDGDRFLSFVTRQPTAAREVLAALARQVQESQAFVDDLLYLDLRGRVAKRLLQMGTPSLAELPADGTVIRPVTHADLASLCGGSRENVSRILSDLQRRGLIRRDGHRYVLRKVGSLAKLAEV